MASEFKIGTAPETLASLDALGTPLPDPQPRYSPYRTKRRLGDLTMKGRGPRNIVWQFPLPTVEQVAQLNYFQSDEAIYIQSPNKDDEFTIYEVLMIVPDPTEDGSHRPGFRGYREGFNVEFIIVSEVTP